MNNQNVHPYLREPHDVSRCDMWKGLLYYLQLGGTIPGWSYSNRNDRFGYWRDTWYFHDNLIYVEEYNDYDGRQTLDYTTKEIWTATGRRPSELSNEWTLHQTHKPFVINEDLNIYSNVPN